MASHRKPKKSRVEETPKTTSSAPQAVVTQRQLQVVIVNRLSTRLDASVIGDDGVTPVQVRIEPHGRSTPVDTDRISSHTQRLVEQGYARLENVQSL